ncbi:MAG: Xaa-Pro aminopeptidase [Saprospiraceae bacterium]|jgi:Xaa-Pro aminopeptidase
MINQRLKALRIAMQENGIDAYIVPSSDAHKSEYVAEHWATRVWVSGFDGSAGVAIITQDHAGVWTDSRYFLQAEMQLADSDFELHKQGIPHAPEHRAWLRDNIKEGGVVACDGRQFSVGDIRAIEQRLKTKNASLVLDKDLIGEIWEDRPSLPTALIFEHDVKYAGKSRAEKLAEIREEMTADYYLVTALDEIAWAFNLRGSDVDCNPVFYAFAIIDHDSAWIFMDIDKVPENLANKLYAEGIYLKSYDFAEPILESLEEDKTVQFDKGTTNILLHNAIQKGNARAEKNIIQALKAIKNETEIKHIRNAMIKDAVALTRLYRWLEKTVEERGIPETEVAEVLASFRKAQGEYHGESFDAIVGYKGNGAIIHYHAQKDTCATIEKDGILLLDSGGQYYDGTTDITRTIRLGEPTDQESFCYTRVLKGYIELASIVFPAGTRGAQLDTLARMHLWQAGLNYGHGTGHGVGFFLNVHEGPQGFAPSPVTSRGTTVFEPGMVTSNEPGFYKDGEYGIRIENLLLCMEAGENEYGKWLKFSDLTLFPIDTRLIQMEQLTAREKKWLNEYHARVFEKVSPRLEADEVAWLREKTQVIG